MKVTSVIRDTKFKFFEAFEFESKTNIRVINSCNSDDQKQPLVVVL